MEGRSAIGADSSSSLASEVGETEAVVDGHYHRLIAYLELGNREQAVVELEAMSGIAAELRQPAQRWQEVATRAMIALGCGDLESARSLIPEALTIGERTQATAAVPAFTLQQFMLDDFEDRMERSEEPLADAVRLLPGTTGVSVRARLCARSGSSKTPRRRATLADFAAHGFSNLPFDFEWLYGATFARGVSAIVGIVRARQGSMECSVRTSNYASSMYRRGCEALWPAISVSSRRGFDPSTPNRTSRTHLS